MFIIFSKDGCPLGTILDDLKAEQLILDLRGLGYEIEYLSERISLEEDDFI